MAAKTKPNCYFARFDIHSHQRTSNVLTFNFYLYSVRGVTTQMLYLPRVLKDGTDVHVSKIRMDECFHPLWGRVSFVQG